MYGWIKNYRDSGLDGIRNKRMNGGRKPVISTDKNKEMVKDIVLNKSPKTFGYLKIHGVSGSWLHIFHHYWK